MSGSVAYSRKRGGRNVADVTNQFDSLRLQCAQRPPVLFEFESKWTKVGIITLGPMRLRKLVPSDAIPIHADSTEQRPTTNLATFTSQDIDTAQSVPVTLGLNFAHEIGTSPA